MHRLRSFSGGPDGPGTFKTRQSARHIKYSWKFKLNIDDGIPHLQSYLDAFVEMVDSTYGCVMFQGGVVTATKNWFYLHPDETMLLSLYLQVISSDLM